MFHIFLLQRYYSSKWRHRTEYAFCIKEFRYYYNKMMGVLNERERLIINMQYGLDGEKKSTFAEIGRHLSITRERARQLEVKAILKLHRTEDLKKYRASSRNKSRVKIQL